ncbi:MAG: hypothetical protein JWR26_3306 [Pedosphaera sp.]|nr:hypothetical protein [Pedosphaera sp.]
MKQKILILLVLMACSFARAGELRISSAEPIVVTAPDQWQMTKEKGPTGSVVLEASRISPPQGRNAMCLVSILGKNQTNFTDPAMLKKLLVADSRPYVSSPDDLSKVEAKELKIAGGLGYYANFIDPDLVGKPVKTGEFKTATPVIVSLGSKYLLKVTILCDDLKGPDYRDAIKIVESIMIKSE